MATAAFSNVLGKFFKKTPAQLAFGKIAEATTIKLQPKKEVNTIGTQLKRLEKGEVKYLPKSLGFLGSPTTTAILAPLALGGVTGGAAGLAAAAPKSVIYGGTTKIIEGAVKESPIIDKAVTNRIKQPSIVGKDVGKAVESTASTLSKIGKGIGKAVDFTKENPLLVGGAAGAAALGAGALALAKKTKEKAKDVTIPQLSQLPTFTTFSQTATPPGAVKAEAPQSAPVAPVKPMKITQKVNVIVNQKVYKRRSSLIHYDIDAS